MAKDFSIIMNLYRNGLKAFYLVHFLNVFRKSDSLCYCCSFICISSNRINLEKLALQDDIDIDMMRMFFILPEISGIYGLNQ